MPAFSDWSTLPEAIAETVARSRLVDMCRKALGLSRTLPEQAALDAALVEALNAPNNGPPVVADDTALLARFPAPNGDQLAQVKAAGYFKRFDQASNGWLPEGVTRAAGPIVGSMAKGCKADGATDDGPKLDAAGAFGLAIATVGIGELDVGVHRVSTNATIPGHVRPLRGSWIQPANGVTVTMASVEEVNFAWIDESLGGKVVVTGVPILRAIWFKEVTTKLWTPPTPATPLVDDGLTKTGSGTYGAGAFTAGHRVQISTNRQSVSAAGVNGETGPSTLSDILLAVNECRIGVTPEDPGCGLGTGETGVATSFSIFTRDLDGDNLDHRCNYATTGKFNSSTEGKYLGWCDAPDHLGCFIATPSSDGDAPPAAGTTCTDWAGGTVRAPDWKGATAAPAGSKPVLNILNGLIRSTSYDIKVSYTYADGSEGPLSLLAQKVTSANPGCFLIVTLADEPPAGADFVNVYAAKTGETLRRILQRPVGPQSLEVHDIPSASDTPVRDPAAAYWNPYWRVSETHPVYPGQGACISTMSPFNLAVRCAKDSACKAVKASAGLDTVKSTIVAFHPTKQGLTLFADSGSGGDTELRFQSPDWDATIAYGVQARVHYNGSEYYCTAANTNQLPTNGGFWSQTAGSQGYRGRAGLVSTYQRLHLRLPLTDSVNQLLRYGVRLADSNGGGSFFCYLDQNSIDAEAPHGVGIIGDGSSGIAGQHTVSELHLNGGFIGARAIPIYFSGSQTGNIHIERTPQVQCNADFGAGPATPNGNRSARSAGLKHVCANAIMTGEKIEFNGGQYQLYLTDSATARDGGGAPIFAGSGMGAEAHSQDDGCFGIYMSSLSNTPPKVRLMGESTFENVTGHAFADIYSAAGSRILSANNNWQNPVILDNWAADIDLAGGNVSTLIRTQRFYSTGFIQTSSPDVRPRPIHHVTSFLADTMQLTGLIAGATSPSAGTQVSVVTVDATLAARTVTIPAAYVRPNQVMIIKRIDASANAVTIQPSANNVEGGATFAMATGAKSSVVLWSDGTDWWVVAKF